MKFYLIALLLLSVEAKKKSKKVAIDHPNTSSYKRPDFTTPGLYCLGCQAVMRETLAKLYNKKMESDILEAMSHMCETKEHWKLDEPYIGDTLMKAGCDVFTEGWGETLEQFLQTRETNDFKLLSL